MYTRPNKTSKPLQRPSLRLVENKPAPAENPPDTFLMNRQGETDRAPTKLERKRFVRPESYFLLLGIAIGFLAAFAVLRLI
jgi:hypothetical protein